MITIVDYGLGNIRAFLNVYKELNVEARTARSANELEGAEKLILPGVGTIDEAMRRLTESGMRKRLEELVFGRGVPVLGVCVGMQMLARASDEGSEPGLGWVAAEVRSFSSQEACAGMPLPHMGWNKVKQSRRSGLFEKLEEGTLFYFLHSYFFQCDRAEDALAVTTYGIEFSCAVNAGNIYGVQFHPEKSHRAGTHLLQNFAEM
jgi:imidazole glycerol-phosphate synthase subunit HisH